MFQFGWGGSLIGLDHHGPIEAFLPVILFPILFGLSMDYEVFLVTRIYEEWHRRGDTHEAVKHGLAATGQTITAAAAIMILVFGAFLLGGQWVISLFGVGLAERRVHRRADHPLGHRAVGDADARRGELASAGRARSVLPHLRVEGQADAPTPAKPRDAAVAAGTRPGS